ncbi:MAG: AraC family transcriptional regulator [Pseudomonadota bacterium]
MLNKNTHFSKPLKIQYTEDALSQILNSIGISGSLLLKEEYCASWAVSVPSSNRLNTLLKTSTGIRVATFHMVERGQIHIKLDDGEELLIDEGEMIVCFSGQGHTLYQGKPHTATPFQEILAGAENIYKPEEHMRDSSTSLICGIFLLHDTKLNPLIATLPATLKLKINSSNEHPRIYGVINLILNEFIIAAGSNNFVIERYLEILCAEIIRTHIDTLPEQTTGWLSALKDPIIGHVLEEIHLDPAENWSVKTLAQKVAMSPSRFAARFVETVGEPPMIYITKWRIYIASRYLKENNSIEQIASDVGYESISSFGRAFKRHMGISPAAWRSEQKG